MTSWITAALRALAEQDREREAPEHVETRLLAAFRRRQVQRRWRTGLAWSLAAAAVIAAFVLAGLRQRTPVAAPSQKVATRPPQLAVADPPQVETPVAERAAPVIARRSPLAQPGSPRNPQPVVQTREVVTQFFPLLDVAPPFERGELLRVTVPASTMRKVGLPVNEDRLTEPVYADVLVGQEGLARAIRFVSYEQ
jgi:hypothetical protein